MTQQQIIYGGQAVLEGVLIRGRRSLSLAVRLTNGSIHSELLPYNPNSAIGVKKIPFVRGAVVLWETLSMGIRALNRSGELAMRPATAATPVVEDVKRPEAFGKGAITGTVILALILGIGIFFLLPHFAIRALDPIIPSSIASNALEGVARLALLLGYIVSISRLRDVQRLFAYHGAEHMAVHAHEHGDQLTPKSVAKYPTAHPRCGTAFLLLVALVSVIVFSFLGRPDLWISISSRVALIPVIAGISYEILRMSARMENSFFVKPIVWPGLLLQKLTTRKPDTAQIEVAIASLTQAIQMDEGTKAGTTETIK
ncbi:MAG: DUF1385 domain-containing protein [Dehalococcoidia bacterium]|nr:DUF1385 domain-containing protein [Dehalococcoidia bacterium]